MIVEGANGHSCGNWDRLVFFSFTAFVVMTKRKVEVKMPRSSEGKFAKRSEVFASETEANDDLNFPSDSEADRQSPIPVVDANSTDHVGLGANQLGDGLGCTEVWGGNKRADKTVKLPGMTGLIHSKPVEPATMGGDVYYLSACDNHLLARVVLADVAGHGEAVGATALQLHKLLKKHINAFDQSALMREINEAFSSKKGGSVQYATAVVLTYYSRTGLLLFVNAGHPPTLWYHADQKTWDWLHERTPHAMRAIEGVPLGLIHGTEYEQTAVRLAAGDVLVLYTDGITECTDQTREELGYEGLLEILRSLPIEPSIATAGALVEAVQRFRGPTPCCDDQSIVVLQQTDACLF
jgi:Stage II sporulation protein E (SpoIIE)